MKRKSENPPNVRNIFGDTPKTPKHKEAFEEFVVEALSNPSVMDDLFECYPDIYISPSNMYGEECLINIIIDHGSVLADEIDWLGGDFCKERASFSVQQDGSLIRIIELASSANLHKTNDRYITTDLGTEKAKEFINYIAGKPWEDLRGVLPFLELDDSEREEIAKFHRAFRQKYFLANASLAQEQASGDSSN